MGIASTSGAVSGIDYTSLVNQLVGIKRQSIDQLNGEKNALEKTKSAYDTLGTLIQDLKSAADALKTADGFKVFTNSISDETIIGAAASSTASEGIYQIVVTNIAKSHKIAADGVALDTSTIAAGPGSFSFQVGTGAVQTVAVDATTTLTGLKDSINALNAGVTASVVNDGSPGTPYRLILTSDTTGSANAVTITQNDTSLNFATTLQAAQDASFTVDGLTFTRSSNSVTDVVPGVSFDLKSADPAKTVTLNVSRDKTAVKDKVLAVINKYNEVISNIKANNRYDTENKIGGAFFGDPVANSITNDLKRVFTSAVSGLPADMNRLLHIGVTSSTEGVLSLDETKFNDMLTENFDGVVDLFVTGPTTNGFGGLIYDISNNIGDYADGRIKGRQNGIDKNIRGIDDDIVRKEAALVDYETQLWAQYTALEMMLAGTQHQGSYLNSI